MHTITFVLASGSPRRRELLARLGVAFEIAVSDVDETFEEGVAPAEMVVRLAERKARAIGATRDRAIVLGADTTVELDGVALNKPVDATDAVRMLRLLRGRSHLVHTGIAVLDTTTGTVLKSRVTSSVEMRTCSDQEIAGYVATGEPLDRAGAYAIQGGAGLFVAHIDGCYTNVVGLPMCETATLLTRFEVVPAGAMTTCTLSDGGICPRLG